MYRCGMFQHLDGRCLTNVPEPHKVCDKHQAAHLPERTLIRQHEQRWLSAQGISEQETATYPPHIDTTGIIELHRNDISGEQAARWDPRFHPVSIITLVSVGLQPEDVADYPRRMTGQDIFHLACNNVDATNASQWESRFNAQEIVLLNQRNIDPHVANAHPRWMPATLIIVADNYSVPLPVVQTICARPMSKQQTIATLKRAQPNDAHQELPFAKFLPKQPSCN